VAWEILTTDQFNEWFLDLDQDAAAAIGARIDLLETDGPNLKRPVVGAIESSRHRAMKELRASVGVHALRVLFVFDPKRQAILLLGGDKTGRWDAWYAENVPRADDLYDEYLRETGQEGQR
jgi:hypothetical protein